MNVKTAKTIRIILLVIACIACIVGVNISQKAAKEAATDVSKINVQITDRDCYYNQNESPYTNGCYHIDFTYKITNNTKVDWVYLKITTYVYDKSGKQLGNITSEFGSSSNFKLKVGETVTKSSGFKDNQPDDFFTALYETPLSDLKFESKVTYGSYSTK